MSGNVFASRPASTTGDNTSAIISNNGARVVWGSEGTGFVVKMEDSPLHREIGSFAFVVLTDAGVDVVGTADGQASGISKLGHHKAGFTVLVQRGAAPLSLKRRSSGYSKVWTFCWGISFK